MTQLGLEQVDLPQLARSISLYSPTGDCQWRVLVSTTLHDKNTKGFKMDPVKGIPRGKTHGGSVKLWCPRVKGSAFAGAPTLSKRCRIPPNLC